MGVWVAATCDAENCEESSGSYIGDDLDLTDEVLLVAPVFKQVIEYLIEYESWQVRGEKLLCAECVPDCEVCNGIDPDCASCELSTGCKACGFEDPHHNILGGICPA